MKNMIEHLLDALDDHSVNQKLSKIIRKEIDTSQGQDQNEALKSKWEKEKADYVIKLEKLKQEQDQSEALKSKLEKEKTAYATELEKLKEVCQKLVSDKKQIEEDRNKKIEENKNFKKENEGLKEDLAASRSALETKEKNLNSLQENFNQLTGKFENLKNENNKLNEQYKPFEDFSKLHQDYLAYREMDEDVLHALSNVLHYDSFPAFLVSCVQENNIVALWDYLKTEILHGRIEPDSFLIKLFDHCFASFCCFRSDYVRNQVEPGTQFDTEQHSRTAASPTQGQISRVLFQGYSKNGKVEHKSLVENMLQRDL